MGRSFSDIGLESDGTLQKTISTVSRASNIGGSQHDPWRILAERLDDTLVTRASSSCGKTPKDVIKASPAHDDNDDGDE